MRFALCAVIMVAVPATAGEVVLRDSDCKVLGSASEQVAVIPGDKAEYTCVVMGKAATCNYRSLDTGKGQGQPTKYEIVRQGDQQIWSSADSGNIRLLIDLKKKKFSYGMSAIVPGKMMHVTKHCVGKVIRVLE